VLFRAAWHEPRSLKAPSVELALPDWPAELDGLRIALISDLHAGLGHVTPARVHEIVDAAVALDADVNLLAGDYLDSSRFGAGRARPIEVAEELARIPRAVAVLGNHDWNAAGPAMGWALREAGVPLLENDALEVRPGLWIAGVADLRHRSADLASALKKPRDGDAVVLVVHDPDFFPKVPARVQLTVAGHLHGGQVNIPVLRRAAMPTRYGDRYLAGHVVEGGRHLYVSSGLGTSGLPLRLLRPPEIPVLTLTSEAPRTRAA
jgi:predicted MPP superfamily phosphohydrolase